MLKLAEDLKLPLDYPHQVTREAIDEATGYKRSSRDAYIQRLKARQLVSIQGGAVRASDVLFEVA